MAVPTSLSASQKVFIDAELLDAEVTFQADIASATSTYGRGGFVTSANYSTYDTAIKLAYTNRAARIAAVASLRGT